MNNPNSYSHSQRIINFQIAQSEKGWAQSLPLQEKNHNINHAINSTIYKSLTKRNELTRKRFHLKFYKIQQGQVIGQTCLNFFKKPPHFIDKQNLDVDDDCKESNFQILKKEIQYLEQNDFDNEKFPNHTPTLSKNGSLCIDTHLRNTDINLNRKLKILSNKPLNGSLLATCKNLTLSRQRPGTSENKEAKKYFSNKKKSAKKNAIEISECQQIIHNKNHNKFELIAPFRKYFQSKRNRQNRSCTLRIDEIYGKKLNKLAHFTLQGKLQGS